MPARRGFISRAASALMFVGAAALALAFPGAASERLEGDSNGGVQSAVHTLAEWRSAGEPEGRGWSSAEVGSFEVKRGEGVGNWLAGKVGGEPERVARELLGGVVGEEKVRGVLLEAALGREPSLPDWGAWWRGYSESYLPELVDEGTDELLGRGEAELEARLGFAREVDLNYRFGLDGRDSHGSAEFLGALGESRDAALAWQSRGFGEAGGEAGGNVGALFRLARDESVLFGAPAQFGVNVFLDYQNDNYGEFWRYSLGGEVRSGLGEVDFNYYAPLTSPRVFGNLRRYSASGFDVRAEVHAPGEEWVSGFWEYYRWHGEFGQEDETGGTVWGEV